MPLLEFIDSVLFVLSALFCFYLLFFAISARINIKRKSSDLSDKTEIAKHSILVLIPAYAEDEVIPGSVNSFLLQTYPEELYEICVISDHMKEKTNEWLNTKNIRLEIADFKGNSTKVKALNLGMSKAKGFDIVVIMDADNVVEPDFLEKINRAFHQGAKVVQAHRTAKKTETPFEILDAVSEEINNSIFRQGHYNAGLSAALIGSGMAFGFEEFKKDLSEFSSIGGFDKELEHVYLRRGIRFHYLSDTYVYDEKIGKADAFAKQRKRWLSAQFFYFRRFSPQFFSALRQGRIDFCDKVLQTAMPPRILFLGGVFGIALLESIFLPGLSAKWWGLWATLMLSLLISIPRFLWNKKLFFAIFHLGQAFLLMLLTLFRLKGANKQFIHTKHGE